MLESTTANKTTNFIVSQSNEEAKGMTSGEQEKALAEKANMAYMTDYVVHRLTMPDKNGNLLQPDLTRPEEQVCQQPSWMALLFRSCSQADLSVRTQESKDSRKAIYCCGNVRCCQRSSKPPLEGRSTRQPHVFENPPHT